jgi:hypothetical protein
LGAEVIGIIRERYSDFGPTSYQRIFDSKTHGNDDDGE